MIISVKNGSDLTDEIYSEGLTNLVHHCIGTAGFTGGYEKKLIERQCYFRLGEVQ